MSNICREVSSEREELQQGLLKCQHEITGSGSVSNGLRKLWPYASLEVIDQNKSRILIDLCMTVDCILVISCIL